jgi:hypothetical protein
MEVTLFGYIFLIICFFALFLPIKYLFAFVVFSCIFQSTAIINFAYAQKGILPFVVSSSFLVFRTFHSLSLLTDIKQESFIRRIAAFVLFAVIATLVLPPFWEKINLFSVSGADFMRSEASNPFSFGLNHITQIGYVVLNFLTVYCIYKIREKLPDDFITKVFILSIVVVLLIGFWEFMAKTTGFISFPYAFFYNNIGYAQGYLQGEGGSWMRLNSTFLEASYCGAFLSASFWAMMSIGKLKTKLLCIPIGIALVLNLSGTGMVSFLSGILIFVYIKKGKSFFPLILFGLILVFIIDRMGYFESMKYMLFNKINSQSGNVRGSATYFTWEIFFQTKGIGAGLGSTRGSSFIVNMFASLGVVGTILLGRLYLYLFKHLPAQNIWLFSFSIVLLVSQCIAIPDFAFTIMWMWFFIATALLPYKKTIGYQNADKIRQ